MLSYIIYKKEKIWRLNSKATFYMSWINEENFSNAPIRVRKYLLHSTSNTQKTHIFCVSIKMQNELLALFSSDIS